MIEIPETPLRKLLDEIDESKSPAQLAMDSIGMVDGIRIIERKNTGGDFPFLDDCIRYVCDRTGLRRCDFERYDDKGIIPAGFSERTSEDPSEGDIAVYQKYGDLKHVGLITWDGSVISKWGTCHVYLHELGSVPTRYGNTVRFLYHSGF